MSINISTSAAIFRWKPACWLRVSGEDAANFLQGQFTNDLRALAAQPAVYGLWLTVKGKVLADSFVLRGGEPGTFWIGSYHSPAAVIRERLEAYVIADDVVIEDVTEAWRAVSVLGAGADVPLRGIEPGGVVFAGRRTAEPNWECAYPMAQEAVVLGALAGAREMSDAELTRLRIAASVPAVPVDLGPTDLPNEGGLEREAISYTKGCYLGQEVMARLKSMGQVRRRLLRVRGSGERVPAPGTALFAGERQVGEVRSAVAEAEAAWSGLAMLSLLHVAPGAALALAAGGPAAITVVPTP